MTSRLIFNDLTLSESKLQKGFPQNRQMQSNPFIHDSDVVLSLIVDPKNLSQNNFVGRFFKPSGRMENSAYKTRSRFGTGSRPGPSERAEP